MSERQIAVPGVLRHLEVDGGVARRHTEFGMLHHRLDALPAVINLTMIAEAV
jgi:hypothetical protein